MRRCRIKSTDDGALTCPEVTDAIVARYRENFCIPAEVSVTKQMIRQHFELEQRLTDRLINSSPENRTTIWSESYDTLYRDLPWLAQTSAIGSTSADAQYGHLLKLIPNGSSVIDIGSGAGSLARYLNHNNRPCVATEITDQRGGTRGKDSFEWHQTDGVHLDEFERDRRYDVVVSTQVIEHLHPDDVQRHMEGARALVKPGGCYVFTTPHILFGPADLSRVFSFNRARFMHLKEYTHAELGALALQAGFRTVEAVYVPPVAIRTRFPLMLRGRWLYRYLAAMERLIGARKLPSPLLRALLFHRDVFIIAVA